MSKFKICSLTGVHSNDSAFFTALNPLTLLLAHRKFLCAALHQLAKSFGQGGRDRPRCLFHLRRQLGRC